jgi:hypothetical protein
MYADQPDVMWSAPGLMTKIAQVLMLAGLIYLIIKQKPIKNSNIVVPPAGETDNTTG